MRFGFFATAIFAAGLLGGCGPQGREEAAVNPQVTKSDEQWRAELTDQQYRILRQQGTEPAFNNAYWDEKRDGVYRCAGCGQPLFSSKAKYKSGTGWPSFYEPIEEANVGAAADRRLWMTRTEVHCSRCGGHLGHVFDDGPEPTGQRYCINSAALTFQESP